MMTKDDIAKVVETYQSKMEAEGWAEEAMASMGDTRMLTYKKDGRMTGVSIASVDQGVQINVTTGKE
jgi:hypothetical protein